MPPEKKPGAVRKAITQRQEVGRRIKEIREALNLSQSEFASMVSRDSGTISRWERGEFPQHMDRRLREISTITGVGIDWLAYGRGELASYLNRLGVSEPKVVPYHVPPPALGQALMESAILAVLKLLEARKLTLSPERTLAGILAVYEAARAQGKESVTDADVTPLVRLLMA